MKCPKCGNENNDSSKFCNKCGEKLETTIVKSDNKNRNIIIALIAIIAVLIVGVVIASGVLSPQLEMQTQEFDGFTIDVPVGSKFVLDESVTKNPDNLFVGYLNDGEHSMDVFGFQVGTNVSSKIYEKVAKLEETDGDVKVYKNDTGDSSYYIVFKKGDEANIGIFGNNLDVTKRMAKSFKDKDFKKLATDPAEPSSPTTQATSSTPASSSPSSLSILGGSFSTGSADEDKTYARINVGTAHAGEDVIVQIWYSRDGNTLNNGNMVPASVHSDGYLEIASADAYLYYPDYATINIYDTNSNLLTSKSVSLSPTSGTQTF